MSINKVKIHEGMLTASGLRVGIVCSRFNEFFVSKLLTGALDSIIRHGGSEENIEVVWVPGAFEIPFAIKKIAMSGTWRCNTRCHSACWIH